MSNSLRPCANFEPMWEKTSFKRTKTPYGNAYSHELRHAYIHRLAAQPGNDADGDGLPTTLPNYPNQTNAAHPKRVSFTFDGVPDSDVLDPTPTVADKDVNLTAKNEPFDLVQGWLPVPPPDYSCVYQVKDTAKTPILYEKDKNIVPVFTLTLANKKTFQFKDLGGLQQINDIAMIKLAELEQVKGQVRLVISFGDGASKAAIENVLSKFKEAVLMGDYQYPAVGDKRSRKEWDAYTFAQNEEPENR